MNFGQNIYNWFLSNVQSLSSVQRRKRERRTLKPVQQDYWCINHIVVPSAKCYNSICILADCGGITLKDFIDFLKLPPNILCALSIASGALLLLPDKIAEKLYMIDFRDKYGFTIGIIFVVSTAILIVLLGSKIYYYFHDKSTSKKLVEAQTKYLKQMKPEQVALISEFIKEPTHTLLLPYNNGLVIELQHLQIVTPAGQTHLVNMLDPQINYFLQPWVMQRINSDDELRQKFY